MTGRTYHAAMYDITAISREGAFVNRCDLENLRHARRSIRSRASIKGIVRTRAGVTEAKPFCSSPAHYTHKGFSTRAPLDVQI